MKTFLLLAILLLWTDVSKAELTPKSPIYASIHPQRLATAIYWAEGGSKTRHPYGVLTKYKHTSPRQACLNTINHQLKLWNGKGDFITFLGKTYSPPAINPYWVSNVRSLYAHPRP